MIQRPRAISPSSLGDLSRPMFQITMAKKVRRECVPSHVVRAMAARSTEDREEDGVAERVPLPSCFVMTSPLVRPIPHYYSANPGYALAHRGTAAKGLLPAGAEQSTDACEAGGR